MPADKDLYGWLTAEVIPEHRFTVLVYFRGGWCPFCRDFGKKFSALLPEIRERGGTIVAVTSQEAGKAAEIRTEWDLAYDVISDPTHTVGRRLHVVISQQTGYPSGMSQPACFVFNPAADHLFEWISKPTLQNIGSALDRPSPKALMERVFHLIETGTDKYTSVRADDVPLMPPSDVLGDDPPPQELADALKAAGRADRDFKVEIDE